MKSLLLRNLFYHWRGNLAVFLGMRRLRRFDRVVLVGDSLREPENLDARSTRLG